MEIIKENKKIWHPQQQIILKKWGEIGSSYRYLHDKAFMYYSKTNFRFALPVIILSTITGTANFAQKSFPESTQDYVPLFIGFLNLTAGLITTIAQFLRVSELLEGHRSASLAYSKFSRNIAIELSLPVKQRTADGTVFIKNCRMEMDRLIEQSPNIPQNILEQFGEKFKDKDSDCMVLVANYASCAEGISLDHVCHNAIYIDRSFQADQYLQSVDRICRLGNNDEKNILILQNKIPNTLKNIDLAVNHSLQKKIDDMGRFLNDSDLTQMSLKESEGLDPIDENITDSDLQSIINEFLS